MQEGRFTPQLIAPCGMNCGICAAFFGYKLNGKKMKPCEGCRVRDFPCASIKKPCDRVRDRRIDYCFECPTFPCERLEKLDKRYRKKYGMSMIDNLKYIQINGINEFLRSEQERWKCPTCGGIICVHNKTCYACGQVQAQAKKRDKTLPPNLKRINA